MPVVVPPIYCHRNVVWLFINGLTYLVLCLTGFLLPQFEDHLASITFHFLTGEVAFVLWLLINGAIPKAA